MNEDKRLKIVRAVCFGIGIVIGLSLMRFVFNGTDAFAGALGGICGALLGLALFRIYLRFAGQ